MILLSLGGSRRETAPVQLKAGEPGGAIGCNFMPLRRNDDIDFISVERS